MLKKAKNLLGLGGKNKNGCPAVSPRLERSACVDLGDASPFASTQSRKKKSKSKSRLSPRSPFRKEKRGTPRSQSPKAALQANDTFGSLSRGDLLTPDTFPNGAEAPPCASLLMLDKPRLPGGEGPSPCASLLKLDRPRTAGLPEVVAPYVTDRLSTRNGHSLPEVAKVTPALEDPVKRLEKCELPEVVDVDDPQAKPPVPAAQHLEPLSTGFNEFHINAQAVEPRSVFVKPKESPLSSPQVAETITHVDGLLLHSAEAAEVVPLAEPPNLAPQHAEPPNPDSGKISARTVESRSVFVRPKEESPRGVFEVAEAAPDVDDFALSLDKRLDVADVASHTEPPIPPAPHVEEPTPDSKEPKISARTVESTSVFVRPKEEPRCDDIADAVPDVVESMLDKRLKVAEVTPYIEPPNPAAPHAELVAVREAPSSVDESASILNKQLEVVAVASQKEPSNLAAPYNDAPNPDSARTVESTKVFVRPKENSPRGVSEEAESPPGVDDSMLKLDTQLEVAAPQDPPSNPEFGTIAISERAAHATSVFVRPIEASPRSLVEVREAAPVVNGSVFKLDIMPEVADVVTQQEPPNPDVAHTEELHADSTRTVESTSVYVRPRQRPSCSVPEEAEATPLANDDFSRCGKRFEEVEVAPQLELSNLEAPSVGITNPEIENLNANVVSHSAHQTQNLEPALVLSKEESPQGSQNLILSSPKAEREPVQKDHTVETTLVLVSPKGSAASSLHGREAERALYAGECQSVKGVQVAKAETPDSSPKTFKDGAESITNGEAFKDESILGSPKVEPEPTHSELIIEPTLVFVSPKGRDTLPEESAMEILELSTAAQSKPKSTTTVASPIVDAEEEQASVLADRLDSVPAASTIASPDAFKGGAESIAHGQALVAHASRFATTVHFKTHDAHFASAVCRCPLIGDRHTCEPIVPETRNKLVMELEHAKNDITDEMASLDFQDCLVKLADVDIDLREAVLETYMRNSWLSCATNTAQLHRDDTQHGLKTFTRVLHDTLANPFENAPRWRGKCWRWLHLEPDYAVTTLIAFPCFLSATRNALTSWNQLRAHTACNALVIFSQADGQGPADVSRFAAWPTEGELIYPLGQQFRVLRIEEWSSNDLQRELGLEGTFEECSYPKTAIHLEAVDAFYEFASDLSRSNTNDQVVRMLEARLAYEVRSGGETHRALLHLGRAKRNTGDLEAAANCMLQAKLIRTELGILRTKDGAGLLMSLGMVKLDQGCFEEAIHHYSDAKTVLSEVDCLYTASGATLMASIGTAKRALRDLQGALAALREAEEIQRSIGTLFTPAGAALIGSIGRTYHDMQNYEKALTEYLRAKELAEVTGSLRTPSGGVLMTSIGTIVRTTGDCASALIAYETARCILVDTGSLNTPGGAALLTSIGTTRHATQDLVGGFVAHKEATQLHHKLGLDDAPFGQFAWDQLAAVTNACFSKGLLKEAEAAWENFTKERITMKELDVIGAIRAIVYVIKYSLQVMTLIKRDGPTSASERECECVMVECTANLFLLS